MQANRSSSKIALIHCGDHWDNQRRVLALAIAIHQSGAHPLVLIYGPRQGSIFLRHGIDVCSLSGADRLIRTGTPIRVLKELGLRNLQEMVSIERRREPRRFETAGARIRWGVRALKRLAQIHRLLARINPARVYIWNGSTGVVAHCLRHLCKERDLEHHFMERGLLPETVFCDPRGVNGASELHALSWEAVKTVSQTIGSVDQDLPRIVEEDTPLRLPCANKTKFTRIIFVPLQVQLDTNIFLHTDEVIDMARLLAAVCDAVADSATLVVARRHPEEIEIQPLPTRKNLVVSDAGTAEEWCRRADLVVTINSTVGLTAILAGTPVVALGRALYTNKGLCTETSLSELSTVLGARRSYRPPNRERVKSFWRVLYGKYTVGSRSDLFQSTFLAYDVKTISPVSPMGNVPFNRWSASPIRVRACWILRVAEFRKRAAQRPAVSIQNQLHASTTIDLSYRTPRGQVSKKSLYAGIAQLSGQDDTREFHECADERDEFPDVVICEQIRVPSKVRREDGIVLDECLQPHIGWIMSHKTY